MHSIIETPFRSAQAVPRLLWHTTPGSGRLHETITAFRTREQQKSLKNLVGRIAVVGEIPMLQKPSESSHRIARALSILKESGVVEKSNAIAVQSLIHETAAEQNRNLEPSARALSTAIDTGREGLTYYDPIAVQVPGGQKNLPHHAYEAVETVVTATEAALGPLDAVRISAKPSVILVMNGMHAAQAFSHINYCEIENGGVAVLDIVNALPERNVWTPRFPDHSDYGPPDMQPIVEQPYEKNSFVLARN